MNQNAKRWVEALRSGEFSQFAGRLRHPIRDGYCCLGVACELYYRATDAGEWTDSKAFRVSDSIHEEYYKLPDPVRRWLGLRKPNGIFADGNNSLALRNDEGASFEEIANLIESEPKGLFDEQVETPKSRGY